MTHRGLVAAAALALALALLAACGDNFDLDPVEECPAGFEPRDGTCADLDECALSLDTCDPRAACTNAAGSYACTCPEGWMGDGTACQPGPCAYDYVEGHGDIYTSWDAASGLGVSLRAELEPGAGARTYPPFGVCIHVPRSSYEEVVALGGRPPGPGWDPVGVAEGQAFWYLPEQPIDGVPWFGIASDEGALGGVPIGVFGSTLSLSLAVDAPPAAALSAWESVSDPEAPPFVFSTRTARLEAPIVTGSHAHLSWAFTHPGEYLVEAVVTGVLQASGEVRASPPVTFRFVVAE